MVKKDEFFRILWRTVKALLIVFATVLFWDLSINLFCISGCHYFVSTIKFLSNLHFFVLLTFLLFIFSEAIKFVWRR